jgi:hypothetical protein
MKKRNRSHGSFALAAAHAAPQGGRSADARTAKELKWTDVARAQGAPSRRPWGDCESAENGVLVRWPFNSKVAGPRAHQDVAHRGAGRHFHVEIDGGYRSSAPADS